MLLPFPRFLLKLWQHPRRDHRPLRLLEVPAMQVERDHELKRRARSGEDACARLATEFLALNWDFASACGTNRRIELRTFWID
jgi:hypothetical protein